MSFKALVIIAALSVPMWIVVDRIIAMIANEGIECIPLWARMLAWFIGGGAGSPQRMY